MKITHKNSPKAGLTEHLPPLVAQALIATGYADEVVLPPRGSAGWLAARQEQAALATTPSPSDTVVPVTTIEWGVQTQKSGQVVILKRINGELLYLSAPDAETPASIRLRWEQECSVNPEANAAALEQAKQAQANRDRADKSATRVTVMSAMFGSKRL